jgi:PhnB protein
MQSAAPEGYHTTTPYLLVPDAERAVHFYSQAFDAVELRRSQDVSGVVRNVQIRIGDSPVMLGIREDKEVTDVRVGDLPRTSIYLFVHDADAIFNKAVTHGATALYKPEDQDYGYREGGIIDPFGITWWIATPLAKA